MASEEVEIAALRARNAELERKLDEQRDVEDALRRSEARYLAILEDQTELICRFRGDGTLTFVNEAYCRYFGKAREDLVGKSFAPLIPEEDQRYVAEQFGSLSRERPVVDYEHRVIAPDGSVRWQQWTDRALFGGDGEIVEYQAVGRDVTDRKRAEDEVRRLNAELERLVAVKTRQVEGFHDLVESLPDGVALARADGAIFYANPALRAMTGLGEAVLGCSVAELYADASRRVDAGLSAASSNGHWRGELSLRRRDGGAIPCAVTLVVIADGSSIAVVTEDRTDARHAEAEREALQGRLVEAQQRALRELSTPLVPLAEHALAMPLIGTIDSVRAGHVLEALLAGVAARKARVVVLDVTGVSVVDSQVADALIRAAQAVRLLGAEVVLTGIQPGIAQTLVTLGVEVRGIVTLRSLQEGIAYALRRARAAG